MSLLVDLTNTQIKTFTSGSDAALIMASTSVLYGCVVSAIQLDNKFNISAGVIDFYDQTTSETNPEHKRINISAVTGYVIADIAVRPTSYICIDKNGNVLVKPQAITAEEQRDFVQLAFIDHSIGAVLSVQDSRIMSPRQIANQLSDLYRALGPINASGNVYYSSGGLVLNRTIGSLWSPSLNRSTNEKNPNFPELPYYDSTANPNDPIRYTYKDGSGSFSIAIETAISPSLYDAGSGILQSVAPNKWTIQRIYMSPQGITVVHYGQAVYSSLDEAAAAIYTELFDVNPAIIGAILRSFLIVKSSATDLTGSDALFIEASNIGGLAAGPSTAGIQTLQQVYSASGSSPQIDLSVESGPVSIKSYVGGSAQPSLQLKDETGIIKTKMSGDGSASFGSSVGIGTESPITELEVTGDTLVRSGQVRIGEVITKGQVFGLDTTLHIKSKALENNLVVMDTTDADTVCEIFMLSAGTPKWVLCSRNDFPDAGATPDRFNLYNADLIELFTVHQNGNAFIGGGGTNSTGSKLNVDGTIKPKSYIVATLPVVDISAGSEAFVTDDIGGPVPCFYDGTDWRRVTDRAIVTV